MQHPTALQHDLIERIVCLIHDDALEPGERLNETRLAQRLNVSRTPVRAALEQLARQGFVERKPHIGARLICLPPLPNDVETSAEPKDDLLVRIARDRRAGRLAVDISEAELMRVYGLSRQAVRNALDRLAELEVIERKPGYGWRFSDTIQDEAAHAESYRFRMVIEPAAILEPGFALAPEWAEEMRARHEGFLATPWDDAFSVAFFEMNAAFHEGICAASGNRFFLTAIRRQNSLRRLSNYDWKYGRERVIVNSHEHLAVLDRIEAGDTELAAILMRRHIEGAERVRG